MNDDIDISMEDFLEHFGVKGMRWGVRKDSAPGVSSKTDRDARKDAEEFARAKMFYGQGAGNRRKLIKATVETKSKKDPDYAKAFDHHVARQDMSKHAEKARGERKSTDRKETAKKRAGYLARRFTGEMGTQAAFTAATVAGGLYLSNPANRAKMSSRFSSVKNYVTNQKNMAKINDFLNKNGFGG